MITIFFIFLIRSTLSYSTRRHRIRTHRHTDRYRNHPNYYNEIRKMHIKMNPPPPFINRDRLDEFNFEEFMKKSIQDSVQESIENVFKKNNDLVRGNLLKLRHLKKLGLPSSLMIGARGSKNILPLLIFDEAETDIEKGTAPQKLIFDA